MQKEKEQKEQKEQQEQQQQTLLESIQATSLGKKLGIQTQIGISQWREGFSRWSRSTHEFAARAQQFRTLQSALCSNCSTASAFPSEFARIAELETKLEPLLREATSVETESYNQVCFRSTPWSALNTLPFALFILSFYKTWLVPTFTIFMPLIAAILPFFLMKSMLPSNPYSSQLTLKQYLSIVWRMYTGMGDSVASSMLSGIPGAQFLQSSQSSQTLTQTLKKWGGYAWVLFTMGQTVYYPIQQAMHFKTIDQDCRDLGFAILELEQKARVWQRSWSAWWAPWTERWISIADSEHGGDPRIAFAWAIEYPFWLKHLMRAVGRFETLICLARNESIKAVRVIRDPIHTTGPQLHCKEIADPFISIESAVQSSFSAGGANAPQHSIVTGPNRGGKSSILRAILTAVVMAHTYGAVFTRGSVSMTRFSWIADGTKLEDVPGKTSMFEREVAFARSIFQPHSGHGLVIYDECFHSTNPADSERTSTLFCSRLWRDPRCISLVSTHIYALARNAPANVQRICVPAKRVTRDKYIFSYSLQPGISTVSSVDALLAQYDFFKGSLRSDAPKDLPLKNKNEQSE